jgi:hypothetical protein
MAAIGSEAAPELAQWRSGNVKQQLAVRLTMPEHGLIHHIGAYLRGVAGYGSIAYRLCLWKWDGATSDTNRLLGQTALKSSSSGSFALGSLVKYTWPLEVPVDLPAGAIFMVGIATDTAAGSAAQWGLATPGSLYAKDSGPPAGEPWPDNMKSCYLDGSGALSAWVDDYDPIGDAWVRRSGVWVQADAVQVRRAGVWTDAAGVQVRRAGAWTDAS